MKSGGTTMGSLRYPSTLISYRGMSFLVIDAPVDTSLPQYLAELRRYDARHLVRACEPTYNSAPLVEAGIQIHDLCFADGEPPPKRIIDEWLALVDEVFDLAAPKKSRLSRPATAALQSVNLMGAAEAPTGTPENPP
eukprot:RCo036253